MIFMLFLKLVNGFKLDNEGKDLKGFVIREQFYHLTLKSPMWTLRLEANKYALNLKVLISNEIKQLML